MSIAPLVIKVLAAAGQPLTASRIVSELVAQGFKSVTKAEVNSYLYMAQNNGTVCKVEIEGLKAPGWKLSESSRQQLGLSPRPVPEVRPRDSTQALSLYRWQQEALGAWEKHHHRGMVEAVTDGNVTADDRELFGEAADIHRVTDRDCIVTLKTFLTNAGSRSGLHLPDGWTVIQSQNP